MNDLLNSKLVADIKDGRLPEVPVAIETTSICMLAGALLLVGVILIVGNKMIQ
ncbi:MAG: hypothetical protein LBU90_03695 [Bacteroidales bacterium]|jgi:hypothetical protein|nr:hypothetical protein [Bacteroidales bacterium]